MTTTTYLPADKTTPNLWRCRHCHASLNASEQDARLAYGWRIWFGTSLTGEPLNVVYCKRCAGSTVGESGEPLTGYDAACETCMAQLSDEEPGPFTQEDADEWKFEHRCEPDVHVIEPKETQ